MSELRISSRYAKALLDLSNEKNQVEEIKADANFILELINESRDFSLMLQSPIVHSDKKKVIIDKVFGEKLNKVTRDFIYIVLRKRRENLLKDIMMRFNTLYNDQMGISNATMYTAIPVDASLKENIRKMLEEKTNSRINLDSKTDESILGGFILRYDDKLLDFSIASQLKELHKHLVN